jgi:hypothetical protein
VAETSQGDSDAKRLAERAAKLPDDVRELLVAARDRRTADADRRALRWVSIRRLARMSGFSPRMAETPREAAMRFLESLVDIAATLQYATGPEYVESIDIGEHVDEEPVQLALADLMRLRPNPIKPVLPPGTKQALADVFKQLVELELDMSAFLRRLRVRLEVDDERERHPIDDATYEPARYFPKGMRDRLRKAKQTGRITTTGGGRKIRYSVAEAKHLWPDEKIGS